MRSAISLMAGVLLAWPLLAAGGANRNNPAKGVNFWSIEREIVLGKQLAAELERQVKLLDDPIVDEYVNRVAQNIARQSDIPIPVTVRVIDSSELNAFTLPGGHVYVANGMLKLTESEAEMAFVLAHELGHVAARHATRQATRQEILQIGSIPLAILGGWGGLALREGAAVGSQLGYLKGARVFESQADLLGLQFMEKSGYDPTAAVDFFERIEAAERKVPNAVARLYETHPLPASRIAETQKRINEVLGAKAEYVITTSEYERLRQRIVKIEENRAAAPTQSPSLIKARPN